MTEGNTISAIKAASVGSAMRQPVGHAVKKAGIDWPYANHIDYPCNAAHNFSLPLIKKAMTNFNICEF